MSDSMKIPPHILRGSETQPVSRFARHCRDRRGVHLLHRALMALIPFLTVVLKAVALIAAPFVARDLVQVLVAPHINVVLERGSVLDGHSLVQVDLSPTITFGVWVLASFILRM